MATTNELNEKMWQTFGHGSPAFKQANHRQKEGILYVRQVIRRFNSPTSCEGAALSNIKDTLREGEGKPRQPLAGEGQTASFSPMNSPTVLCAGREESVAGEPVKEAITPVSSDEIPQDIYHLTDKAIRSRILDCWLETLETEEIESIRDACDVEIVSRQDSDDWEEVVLATDEREEEATKTK